VCVCVCVCVCVSNGYQNKYRFNHVLFYCPINTIIINLLRLVFYSILLHVSALHISHRQEENWFTKRVERAETNSGCEVVVK